MAGGALFIWLAVIGIALYAIRTRAHRHDPWKTKLFIIGGGALFPTVVLGILLIGGMSMMPSLLDHGSAGGLKIRVIGEQWWWRVHYEMPDGARFELANELRLPIGRRVPLWLESTDVIHSFWVPSLGGKIDMIPGRVNRMALEPTRTGTFHGACAEYCGLSHAQMKFRVIVVEEPDFAAWAAAQQEPARPPASPAAERGASLFSSLGCGACHTVAGTSADGVVGPDLTHVGSRITLGAGVLDNDRSSFRRWLADLDAIKPGVHMPSFDMLAEEDLLALAAYLKGLQ